MIRWLAMAFGGGVLSAGLYVAILGGSFGAMVLAYLTPLPLFLVGLALGAPAVLTAAVASSLLVLGLTGQLVSSALFALGNALPVWLLVRQALLARTGPAGLEWYPAGRLVLVLTGLGLALVTAVFVGALGQSGGLQGVVEEMIAGALGAMVADGMPLADSDVSALASVLTPVFPGGVALSWLAMLVINGLLAQGLLNRRGRAVRPSPRVRDLELPDWTPLPLAAAAAGALLVSGPLGYLCLNLTVVLTVPFFFAGLAVVHAGADRSTARVPLLAAFYLFLMLFGWPAFVVVAVGLLDQWFNWRRRAVAAPTDRRDE